MPVSTTQQNPLRNLLLAALPADDFRRLVPHLEYVALASGEVLYEPGEQMRHCFFPTTAVISLLYTTQDGVTAEMGLVGNHGIVGVALFMGGATTSNRALALIAGGAFRMKPKILQAEFVRGGAFQHLLLLYTQALLTQTSHTAICNRLHSTEQRLCRWLLFIHDRVDSDELNLTQELISHSLGVRREGVTVAAGHLQDRGLISYRRGHIMILDRPGLEACGCECYRTIKDEHDRLLG